MTSANLQHTISFLKELFPRFGAPETVVTDNGCQFTSADFATFLRSAGVRHVRTAPYHSSSNCWAEHFMQSFKNALKKSNASESLDESLQQFLLSYRNTPHATTGEAPAVLLMKRKLRTKLDAIKSSLNGLCPTDNLTKWINTVRVLGQFQPGDDVYARNFRPGERWFRATVFARVGPVTYKLRVATQHGTYTSGSDTRIISVKRYREASIVLEVWWSGTTCVAPGFRFTATRVGQELRCGLSTRAGHLGTTRVVTGWLVLRRIDCQPTTRIPDKTTESSG